MNLRWVFSYNGTNCETESSKFNGKMFNTILFVFIDIFRNVKYPLKILAFLKGFKAPFTRKQAVPFLISSENSKRALNIYRVFRKLSYVNQPGFLGRGSPKNPGFFVLKKGAGCQPPIPGRSPVSGRTAFFSHTIIPCLKKGAGRNGG